MAGATYQKNSVPFAFNYIRKASKLTGYNLFPYFEKFGFFRTVFMEINDYGNKYVAQTKDMLQKGIRIFMQQTPSHKEEALKL